MVRQPFPAGQRLVETQPPMVHMGGGTMMDAFVSRSPSHMIPVDVSTMSRQQAEMLRSYGGVQSHVHVVDPGAMNAPARQLIPNLSQPPPAYQGAPPVADVSEKRRNLYFHLCGLFPEDRVIEVMQQHPTETSPQVLCTYLIRMSYVWGGRGRTPCLHGSVGAWPLVTFNIWYSDECCFVQGAVITHCFR